MTLKILGIALLLCVTTLQGFASLIDEMTLEEKVGQLFMVHFNGESANEEAKALIQERYVGGIIYYNWANGLNSPLQVRELSNSLQKLTDENPHPTPLLIAADQEGGLVSRLTQGFTVFSGNKALGMTNEPILAERCAFAIGQELQAVGVNMNLSPCIDVNSNPKNPVIGIRAFSDSPSVVVEFAKSALKGYHNAGLITTLKHFPGHGDMEIDSHEDLPQIKKSLEELHQTELFPFAKLYGNTDAIMTAHLIVDALDPINCTTLSKKSLEFLRNEIGFKGIIISDSLVMKGLLKNCHSLDEAAIQAFNSGCDLLLLAANNSLIATKNVEIGVEDCLRIQQTFVKAIQNGQITEQRLNESVKRILDLKSRYLSQKSELLNQPLGSNIDTEDHRSLAAEIANKSIRIKKNTPFSLENVNHSRIALFAPKIAESPIRQSSLQTLGKINSSFFFEDLNPTDSEMKAAQELAIEADLIIFCTYNAWKNEKQTMLGNALLMKNIPFIHIALRDPIDADLFPKANFSIITFNATTSSLEAASNQIVNSLFGISR